MIMRKGGINPMKKLSSMLAISLAMAMTIGMTAFAAEESTAQNVSVNTKVTDVSNVTTDESAAVTTRVEVTVDEVKEEDLAPEVKVELEEKSVEAAKAVSAPSLTEEKKTSTGEAIVVKKTELPVAKAAVVDKAAEAAVSKLVDDGVLKLASNATATTTTNSSANSSTSQKSAITVHSYFDIDLATMAGDTANNLSADDKTEALKNGITLSFTTTIKPSSTQKLVVLHEYETGKWESVPAKLAEDGTVIATFSSLSPVIITTVEVEEETPVVEDEKDTSWPYDTSITASTTAPAAAAASGKSPKTAETASAAGVIALAAAASAVVASKKIRYNA
jgi:hypothetical protein